MSAVAKFLKETYSKQTFLEAVKAGGWKAALDGTLAYATLTGPVSNLVSSTVACWRKKPGPDRRFAFRQATLIHGPNAKLVGTDALGNKYYERMTEQFGRCLSTDNVAGLGCQHTTVAIKMHEHSVNLDCRQTSMGGLWQPRLR